MLSEIAWSDPILPAVADSDWESEVKRKLGTVSEAHRRMAPSAWVREATLTLETYRHVVLPTRLVHIGSVVTAQENACRYCYGATRAYLRLLGYSESLIGRIERQAQLAELDEKDRAFIEFCRSLARSRPRPAKAERDALLRLGYTSREVAEMAFFIAGCCYFNRLATLMACPPEAAFERFVASPLGRVVSLLGPVTRAVQRIKGRRSAADTPVAPVAPDAPFGRLLNALEGLPAAHTLEQVFQRAFAPSALPVRTKALMFAVVARALDCGYCTREAAAFAVAEGMTAEEVEAALSELGSPRLEPFESQLLGWVRDTVHYEPERIQAQTRELSEAIGAERTLDAIGIASLANATVRLAMLLA